MLDEHQQGRRRWIPVAALLLLAGLFAALGVWQVKRLAWKEALIARVDAGLAAPSQDVTALPQDASLEYRKLRLTGRFEPAGTTLVTASTVRGSGYWAMEPLRLASGEAIWINRGFVPGGTTPAMAIRSTPPGSVTLIGLARLNEHGGTWLRANRSGENRWYSRDIAAIAAQRGIGRSETRWFLDAGVPVAAPTETSDDESVPTVAPSPSPDAVITPIPGLTVIRFANSHLSYAITWFLLAALSLAGLGVLVRTARNPAQ